MYARGATDLGWFVHDPTALIGLCCGSLQANAGFLLAGAPVTWIVKELTKASSYTLTYGSLRRGESMAVSSSLYDVHPLCMAP